MFREVTFSGLPGERGVAGSVGASETTEENEQEHERCGDR